jgi:hypothetical protein
MSLNSSVTVPDGSELSLLARANARRSELKLTGAACGRAGEPLIRERI